MCKFSRKSCWTCSKS